MRSPITSGPWRLVSRLLMTLTFTEFSQQQPPSCCWLRLVYFVVVVVVVFVTQSAASASNRRRFSRLIFLFVTSFSCFSAALR